LALYKESMLNKIEDDLEGRNQNWQALDKHVKNISDEFDETKTYAVGDYAIYDNMLYRCAIETTGEWNPDNWIATSVGAEIASHLADREAHSPGSSILMPLRNGWFAGGVETYGECRCYKDRNRVYFTGLVNPAVATDDMFCQLPEGYRPAYRKMYYAVLTDSPAEYISIYPDGRMVASSRTKGSVCLFGISFSII